MNERIFKALITISKIAIKQKINTGKDLFIFEKILNITTTINNKKIIYGMPYAA